MTTPGNGQNAGNENDVRIVTFFQDNPGPGRDNAFLSRLEQQVRVRVPAVGFLGRLPLSSITGP
jgi:hypothetical protein